MIEILITCTSKPMGRTDEGYSTFHEEREVVDDIDAAKEYLKKRYRDCKRQKIYIDKKDQSTEHIGWIYCFRGEDWSHYPVSRWYQQDWVVVYDVSKTPVIL